MSAQPHILVVDDDERLCSLLRRYLTENGYLVSTAANAWEARAQLGAIAFDLIVLDVMMPGESGVELTRALRQKNAVPVLLLTAMGESADRIAGLEAGADDYLTKPFEPKELLLRIGSILRRASKGETARRECKFGGFTFDLQRGELRRGNIPIHLTSAESQLLALLAGQPGEVLTREDLAGRTGNAPRSIDVQVTRLRRKIEGDPRQPLHLQTMRGRGYVLWPD
jgi:two-component system phosphate regulon response regulator OmpR